MVTEDEVLEALRSVIDPEAGIDIVDLGLVERVAIDTDAIRIGLIMTTPACPQGDHLSEQARRAVEGCAPGAAVTVELLDEPFWTPERMSDTARQLLGWG
jgi:metal-sulfur cluster biosynthetic enzyme